MPLNSYKDKDWSTQGKGSSEKDVFGIKGARTKNRSYKNDEGSLSQPKQSKRSKHTLNLKLKSTSKSCYSTANTVDDSSIAKSNKSNESLS